MRSECSNLATQSPAISNLSDTAVLRERPTQAIPLRRAATIELARDSLYPLHPTRAAKIECLQGTLWITQAGDIRDIILSPGMTFSPAVQGTVVIQPLEGPARMRVV